MNNNAKALKSGIWYTVCSFLIRGVFFLTTPLFTRILTQEEYGLFNNFSSWQGILVIIMTFNVKATLISARYDFEKKFDEYIFSILVMSTTSVLVWMGLINIFSSWSERFFAMDNIWLNLMMINIIFSTAFELFQDQQRFLYKYKLQVFLSVLVTLSTVGFSVLLVVIMKDSLSGRIIGSILPNIVVGMILYILFAYKGRRINISYWKYAIKICLPYIPHLLSLTVLGSMDRIMITKFCGASDTALYSLAYNCGCIVSILLTSMNTAYAPWLAEQLHINDIKSIRRFSKIYIGCFVCGAAVIMIIAPEILMILGGKNYLPAMYVMPPVAMGCVCQFLYTMFVNIEQIKKKTVGMAIASVSAAAINYILNLIFIPKFGYVAAAYTTLLGYLWLLVAHMYFVCRLKMSDTYSYRFIIFVVIVMSIFTIGINLLYSNNLARYSFLGLYVLLICVVILINKDKVKEFISIFKK